MKSFALLASISLITAALPSLAYTWPDAKVDEIEDIMYLHTGFLSRNFSGPVTPCTSGIGDLGSITAAEWVRSVFHDAGLYNHSTKTGGLDASIMFELTYDNNSGVGFNHTFEVLGQHQTIRSSVSDLLAVSLYTAFRGCGGLAIPVRAGRIDATAPYGIEGGPVPSDNITTLTTKFAGMGFNVPEMIALVACGHSVGGVHGGDTPTVLGNNTVGNFDTFDTNPSVFDNSVATQYLNNTTTNPLVVSPYANMNSDSRVFSADNNVTISSFADTQTFLKSCQSVFTTLINMVNSEVVLSDVITPIVVKPTNVGLTLNADGTITFSGYIRVHNSNAVSTRSVTISYVDRSSRAVGGTISTTPAGSAAGFDDSFEFYSFSHTLVSTGISSFTVHVDGTTYNNGGAGFPLQDTVIFQSSQSCITSAPDSTGNYQLKVVSAVATSAAAPTISIVQKIAQTAPVSNVLPSLQPQSYPMTKTSSHSGYTLYSYTQSLGIDQVPTTFDITSGSASVEFIKTTSLAACT